MTEPIYDFDAFERASAPVDDPETQAILELMAHDPEWHALQARLEKLVGKMEDYHYVVTTVDGTLHDFPMPSTSEAQARGLLDDMFRSWHSCRSFIPASQFRDRTYSPTAVRLELISPDGMRRLGDLTLEPVRR